MTSRRPVLAGILVVCVLGAAFLFSAREGIALRAAHAAWLSGEARPAPPPAASGQTRTFQENH